MAIYKNVSSKTIIRKVFRDLNISNDNWVEDSIEWMGEALEHIGSSSQLCQKGTTISIADYTGVLPSDLYYINQVAVNTTVGAATASELTAVLAKIKVIEDKLASDPSQDFSTDLRKLNERMLVLQNIYLSDSQGSLVPMAYSTDTFPTALHCNDCVNEKAISDDTYFINSGHIKTSFEKGTVCLSYTAFPVDDDCYPMVPDDISFKEALFWYIVKKLILRGMRLPIQMQYDMAENQWKYYCSQARNAANYPDIDRMESFMNQWVRLIPEISRADNGFKHLNVRENLDRS